MKKRHLRMYLFMYDFLIVFRRVLVMGAQSAELYTNLGLCCLYSQQLDVTFSCFERALTLAVESNIQAEIWYNLSHLATVNYNRGSIPKLSLHFWDFSSCRPRATWSWRCNAWICVFLLILLMRRRSTTWPYYITKLAAAIWPSPIFKRRVIWVRIWSNRASIWNTSRIFKSFPLWLDKFLWNASMLFLFFKLFLTWPHYVGTIKKILTFI